MGPNSLSSRPLNRILGAITILVLARFALEYFSAVFFIHWMDSNYSSIPVIVSISFIVIVAYLRAKLETFVRSLWRPVSNSMKFIITLIQLLLTPVVIFVYYADMGRGDLIDTPLEIFEVCVVVAFFSLCIHAALAALFYWVLPWFNKRTRTRVG